MKEYSKEVIEEGKLHNATNEEIIDQLALLYDRSMQIIEGLIGQQNELLDSLTGTITCKCECHDKIGVSHTQPCCNRTYEPRDMDTYNESGIVLL
jgi:hypothetical protein